MREGLSINSFLKMGFLLSPDFSYEGDPELFLEKFQTNFKGVNIPLILHNDLLFSSDAMLQEIDLNWDEFEKARAVFELGKDKRIYDTFLHLLNYPVSQKSKDQGRTGTP